MTRSTVHKKIVDRPKTRIQILKMPEERRGCTFNFGRSSLERKAEILEESNHAASDDKIDSLIANALNQLSLDEREAVYYEMHGVAEITKETPELVQFSLNQLEAELDRIKHTHPKGSAYKLAEDLSPDYVQDHELRMKFLRCEKFDIQKTSERFIRYFACKLLFFGKEKLCKNITLQDLNKDDLKALKAGYMQVLPIRDRSGRAVWIGLPRHQTFKIPNNKVGFFV